MLNKLHLKSYHFLTSKKTIQLSVDYTIRNCATTSTLHFCDRDRVFLTQRLWKRRDRSSTKHAASNQSFFHPDFRWKCQGVLAAPHAESSAPCSTTAVTILRVRITVQLKYRNQLQFSSSWCYNLAETGPHRKVHHIEKITTNKARIRMCSGSRVKLRIVLYGLLLPCGELLRERKSNFHSPGENWALLQFHYLTWNVGH